MWKLLAVSAFIMILVAVGCNKSPSESEQNHAHATETVAATTTPPTTTVAVTTTEPPRTTHPLPDKLEVPKVYINMDSGNAITSRNTYASGTFSITAQLGGEFESFETVSVNARGRGNSTWRADKKPYRLNFESRVSFLGLPYSRNFVLLANAYDQSHIRNSIAFAAARKLRFSFVPTAVHVDLYINGVYQGLYTIGDFVRHNSDGIGLNRDGGFLLEFGGEKHNHVIGVDWFRSTVQHRVRIRYPAPGESLTREQFNQIKGYFDAACTAVKRRKDYQEHIDMDTLIDYFLLSELLYNFDGSLERSVFLYKNPDEPIKIASVWDFDLAMGNHLADGGRYTTWANVHIVGTHYSNPTWINHLIRDPMFQYMVRKRWNEIGGDLMHTVISEIIFNREYLEDAVRRNNEVVSYRTNRFASPRTERLNTWEEQLDYILNFVQDRKEWMDNQIIKFPCTQPEPR